MGISSQLEAILQATAPNQPVLVRIRWTASEEYFTALRAIDQNAPDLHTLFDTTLGDAQAVGMKTLSEYLDSENIPYAESKHFYRALVAAATPVQIRAIAARPDVESIATQKPATSTPHPTALN